MIIITTSEIPDESKKNIIFCVILAVTICFLLYKFLSNRTVEIEKFSNTPIVYSSKGEDINIKK